MAKHRRRCHDFEEGQLVQIAPGTRLGCMFGRIVAISRSRATFGVRVNGVVCQIDYRNLVGA